VHGNRHHVATMSVIVTDRSGGFEVSLEIETDRLLPGRLVDVRLRLAALHDSTIRGARVTLIGKETWRHDETEYDSEGRPHTETTTSSKELPRVPVVASGPLALAAGQTQAFDVQIPVPSLGPATFTANELKVEWSIRANLDVPGFDPSVTLPVVILQPTALLRAGVVRVAEYALYPAADGEAGGFRGSVWIDPSPLCIGAPFRGRLDLETGETRTVQEVRLELRVTAASTVVGGRQESITMWVGQLAGPGAFGGAAKSIPFESGLPERWLPTIETDHGRSDAQLHVVIATAWSRDPHLVRDVAICSTTEV
jgi:Arrestin (or S-antigen), C-terminal domain